MMIGWRSRLGPARTPVAAVGFLTVLLLAGAAPGCSAQSSVQLRVSAVTGLVNASGAVPNAPVLDDPGAVLSYRDFAAAPALGLGIELRAGALPVALRVLAARSGTTTETGTWGCGLDDAGNPLPCPSILIEAPTDVALSVATLGLVGDVGVGPATLHPILGIGVQRWSYRWDPTPVGSFSLAPGEHSDDSAALYAGLAASIDVGRVRLGIEYGEHLARSRAGRPRRVQALSFGAAADIL